MGHEHRTSRSEASDLRAPVFEITVMLDNGHSARARGQGTKRSIEQAAAAALLKDIGG